MTFLLFRDVFKQTGKAVGTKLYPAEIPGVGPTGNQSKKTEHEIDPFSYWSHPGLITGVLKYLQQRNGFLLPSSIRILIF
jgi:hypothetical protein